MRKEFIFSSGSKSDFDKMCAEVRKLISSGEHVSGMFVWDDKPKDFWLREAASKNRMRLGMTQWQLAKLVGTTQAVISDFETGRSTPNCWKDILKKCRIRFVHPDFCEMAFAGATLSEVAAMVRFKTKVSVKTIALDCGITQKEYLEFEKGVADLTFDETERVLGYFGLSVAEV